MSKRKLTCLIIEDEPIAAEVLEDYISQVSFLDLKGKCKDAVSALEQINKNRVDVIFLDIHLPKIKGLDFLRTLEIKPQTILTTAYHQYALDAFEEGVVDYLMKPIEFSRFLKAVNKLDYKNTESYTPLGDQSPASKDFHFFNVNKKMVKVYIDDILFVESLKDYCRIHLPTDNIVTRMQIGEMERLFESRGFLRTHRSFLISKNKIKAYSGASVEIGGHEIPIGRSYKSAVDQSLSEIL